MSVQTTYNTAHDAAYAGMLGDSRGMDVSSFLNEEAVELPFGIAMAQGSADDGMLLPAASGDKTKLVGVVAHTHARDNIGTTTGVKAGARANVLTRGCVWVVPEQDVTPASAVYVRYATGAGGSQKGAFRTDADTASAVAIKGARFLTSASAGKPALLEFSTLTTRLS